MEENEKKAKGFEYRKFATPRIIGGIAIVFVILWLLSLLFGSSDESPSKRAAGPSHQAAAPAPSHDAGRAPAATAAKSTHADSVAGDHTEDAASHAAPPAHSASSHRDEAHTPAAAPAHGGSSEHTGDEAPGTAPKPAAGGHGQPVAVATDTHDAPPAAGHAQPDLAKPSHDQPAAGHDDGIPGHPLPETGLHKPTPKGVAFVEASIAPLQYELEERWWGWRPNDLINLTDNINMFQLGVLEVTRRTTVALAERISRTGTTDAYDENLEAAMNWFMVKASSYWFPSAESKYEDGLEELQVYLEKLQAGKATFYTRTDNLIPLLASFEDLLGSCDENLVKQTNADGTPISTFAVDNYFYYTKGVASSMATVLEAVHHDFLLTLESRHGTELLHHAVVSCQQAAELEPWVVLNSDLNSVLANHRANMAAPISHARFYLGQLIKTLST